MASHSCNSLPFFLVHLIMSSLKTQIESHLPDGQIAEEDKGLAWIKEVQYILIHLVEEQDGRRYVKTFPVDAQGLDISAIRFVTPFKNGIKAGWYPSYTKDLLEDQNYNGIYAVNADAPAAVVFDQKIYIYPDGGKITGFGVTPPDSLTDEKITGMPMPFQSACIYYTAIQFLKSLVLSENQGKDLVGSEPVPIDTFTSPVLSRENFTEAIALALHPSAPADPSITADQASVPNVTGPTITSPDIPAAETYNKENINLVYDAVDARSLDDDIEMLSGEIQILQKKVEEANTRMNDELNRVNTLIQGFQSKVQHSLEQGRLTMTATTSQEQLKLNQELSNAQNNLSAAIEEKRLIFSKYQNEINSVIGENQNKIAEFQSKISIWAQKNDLNVAEFQVKANEVITKYQTDIQAQFEKHRSEVQKVSTNTGVKDSKIQGYIQSLSILTQQFSDAVQSYIRSVQRDPFMPAPADPEVPA